jgi:hypothetical protein
MDTCHFFYHLVAHVFAYVTCYRNTNGWKCTSIPYICCMYNMPHATNLCNLFYATRAKISCTCHWKLVANDSCKR